ncbi:hypothetical protein ACJBS6_12040, partial [Streptococcus suis]
CVRGYYFTGKCVTVEDGNTSLIYMNTPEVLNGWVVVYYVTDDCKVIKDAVTDSPTSPVVTEYDSTD